MDLGREQNLYDDGEKRMKRGRRKEKVGNGTGTMSSSLLTLGGFELPLERDEGGLGSVRRGGGGINFTEY